VKIVIKNLLLRIVVLLVLTFTPILTACSSGNEVTSTTITTTESMNQTTTIPVTTDIINPTTTTPTITTSDITTTPSWEWLTKTATPTITEIVDIQKEQIRKAVIDLVVPEFKPVGDPIPILITITNPEDSEWTSDIPITFINQDDENEVVTWMINVTLDEKETKQVFVEGIQMGEGGWNVKVGFKTRVIFTS
jgi:hypothetical protein